MATVRPHSKICEPKDMSLPTPRPGRIDQILHWLCRGRVSLKDGRLLSWVGAGAYPYDEATCYLIRLLAYVHTVTGDSALRRESERRLDAVYPAMVRDGALGREDQRYLFDTGIGLAALTAHARLGGDGRSAGMRRLAETIVAMIQQRQSVRPAPPEGDAGRRWSQRFGPHLLKVAMPLLEAADLLGRPDLRAVAHHLVDEFTEAAHGADGLFLTEERPDRTYLHGSCYAVEGLLFASRCGVVDATETLRRCADRLAALQLPDGGLPHWWGVADAQQGAGDVTAQAVRIWQCVARARYRANIQRALAFLDRLTAPEAGVRYDAQSQHVNSWVSIFTVQALLWEEYGADPRWIV